jgi:hypothetical protein
VPAPAKPAAARPAPQVLADALKAIGGAKAWAAHKTMHAKLELVFQGIGISGGGDRYSTATDKSLTVSTLPGIGTVREGSNGKVSWAQDPVNGLRLLEGPEAEQARLDSAWNSDGRLAELYPKIESVTEPRPGGGAPLECLVMTPKPGGGGPVTNCYDPATHLQVSQKGKRATPQGDTPFEATLRDWREVGGVKMAYVVDTQAGPLTFTTRITDVTLDEPMDDKMFEPPSPPGEAGGAPGAGGKASKRKGKGKAAAPTP